MDFTEVPVGFGKAQAQNETALNAYAVMTEEQKQAVLAKARKARSQQEMWKVVSAIENSTI